jgi:hypothetical protein
MTFELDKNQYYVKEEVKEFIETYIKPDYSYRWLYWNESDVFMKGFDGVSIHIDSPMFGSRWLIIPIEEFKGPLSYDENFVRLYTTSPIFIRLNCGTEHIKTNPEIIEHFNTAYVAKISKLGQAL